MVEIESRTMWVSNRNVIFHRLKSFLLYFLAHFKEFLFSVIWNTQLIKLFCQISFPSFVILSNPRHRNNGYMCPKLLSKVNSIFIKTWISIKLQMKIKIFIAFHLNESSFRYWSDYLILETYLSLKFHCFPPLV